MSDKPKSKLFDDSDEEDDYKPSDTAASTQPVPEQTAETTNEQAADDGEEYVPNGGAGMDNVDLGGLGNGGEEQKNEEYQPYDSNQGYNNEEYNQNYDYNAPNNDEYNNADYVPPVEPPADQQIDSSTGEGNKQSQEPDSPALDVDLTPSVTTTGPSVTPSEAEAQLAAEAEKAKNQLLDDINKFKAEDDGGADEEPEQEDPRVQKFTVQNPVKISNHVKYTVTGIDDEGDFTEVRRYREFYAVGQILRTRWPGCYVPSIPEKKIVGQSNELFVEERRSLLERFMKEIAKYDYIVYSKEFKIFARGKGEIDKVLFALPKQTPMQVLEKYRLNFKINEDQDAAAINTFKDRIAIFQQFLKKCIGIMEIQKKQIKAIASVRDRQDKYEHDLMYQLMKYEDIAVAYYADQDYNKRILTHPTAEDLKEKLTSNLKKVKNPYKEAYLWIKGEFLDVSGMYDCLQGREGVMKAQLNTEQKKKDDQKELEKLTVGKATLKSFFKSKSQKESNILTLQAALEIADQEIIDFKKLINFLTIYHGEAAIPKFKKAKSRMYLKALNSFCVKEISNAHLCATLYHSLLDMEGKGQ